MDCNNDLSNSVSKKTSFWGKIAKQLNIYAVESYQLTPQAFI